MEKNGLTEDDVLAAVLDAGAEDVNDLGDSFEIISEPTDLVAVRTALQDAGIDYDSAEAGFQPSVTVPLDADGARKVMKLVDALEDSDDVQDVYTNADSPTRCWRRSTRSESGPESAEGLGAARRRIDSNRVRCGRAGVGGQVEIVDGGEGSGTSGTTASSMRRWRCFRYTEPRMRRCRWSPGPRGCPSGWFSTISARRTG